MHPNNPHKNGYDFKNLIEANPPLKQFVIKNVRGKDTIDFSNAAAVKCFNQTLLKYYYRIDFWDIPDGYLCPPVPSRLDYLLSVNELEGIKGQRARVLDVGVGANCIYPLLGKQYFDWKFVATDINPRSIEIARAIIEANKFKASIQLRLQKNKEQIFKGIMKERDVFDLVVCNPPFFEDEKQALLANKKKWIKLGHGAIEKSNFGGQANELWTNGGAYNFAKRMIMESLDYTENLKWVSILISRKHMLNGLKELLSSHNLKYKVLEMRQGNKQSRILAWRV